MSPNKDSELSIVVVGDSQCGKTQLINKFQNFNFSKVYNPTGFNKIEKVVKYNQTDVKLTVWDTSGLPSYTTLRPLVYSECSAVLLCYTGAGLTGLENWVTEVRKSTGAPIVLAHTRSDEAERLDMRRTCRACERLGAMGWETTSASSGQNVNTVFDLCVAAAMESNVKSDNKKDRLVRPNTLQLSSLVSNLKSRKNNKTWEEDTRNGNNNTTKYSEHVYENPEEIDRTLTSTVTDLSGTKLKKRNVNKNFVIPGRGKFGAGFPRDWSPVRGDCDDTRHLDTGLRTRVDQSVFSPQSSKSCLKSPTLSDLDGVPMRPHSSQSACVRPSRLYRHSAHLAHRLSLASSQGQAQPLASGRLKPVSIPLSPNCDINHNKEADTRRGAERFRFSSAVDNTSILSPTGSTVSSLLSIPVFPGYRSHQSDTSSVSALTSVSVYSDQGDQDSVTGLRTPAPPCVRYKVYSREKKKELCSIM